MKSLWCQPHSLQRHCRLLKSPRLLYPASPLDRKVLTLQGEPGGNAYFGIVSKRSAQEAHSTMARSYKVTEMNVEQHRNMMKPCLQRDHFGFGRPCGTIHHGLERLLSTGSKQSHGPLFRNHPRTIILHISYLLKILPLVLMDSRMLCGV